MLALELGRKVLLARSDGRVSSGETKPTGFIVADLMADASFFIGFIIYPSTSTLIFMFFMSEKFGGPGEDGLTVMRYDRAIETNSALYGAFIPYALVMMVVYPLGIPLQVADETRDSNTSTLGRAALGVLTVPLCLLAVCADPVPQPRRAA